MCYWFTLIPSHSGAEGQGQSGRQNSRPRYGKKWGILDITFLSYGVKVLVRQNGTYEEDVIQPIQPFNGRPYYRDVDVTENGEWLALTSDPW
jgi:hypothetical protein